MKLKNIRLKTGAKIFISTVVLVSVIGFTETRQDGETCKDIVIRISNQHENYYINEEDVIALMTSHGSYAVKGQLFKELNLKSIEQRVAEDKFIKNAEIYKDLKGNLLVNVKLRRPVARIMQRNAPHAYVAEDGSILPVSNKFSSRVILVSGAYASKLVENNLTESEEGKKIFRLINYINNDDFWKAQIAQVEVDSKMNIVLYPQVTKQYVEFGQPEDLEDKFEKLRIFYKQILPQKGWNTYDRVNLEYEGQIIAE